jgi:hypothetical protein
MAFVELTNYASTAFKKSLALEHSGMEPQMPLTI